jgi:hypothetical protein
VYCIFLDMRSNKCVRENFNAALPMSIHEPQTDRAELRIPRAFFKDLILLNLLAYLGHSTLVGEALGFKVLKLPDETEAYYSERVRMEEGKTETL